MEDFQINFEAVAIVNSMLIENINMQLESEVADLLDRRMMSLFGVNEKPATKLEVQNTSRKLQKAQHVTKGGFKSPPPRANSYMEDHEYEEKTRASLTIGLNPSKTF